MARCPGAWAILVGLVGSLATGCGTGSTARASLPDSSLVAVCLTDQDDGAADTGPSTDLCVVERDGSRRMIRWAIDAAMAVALSPDRSIVAFVDGGRLRTIAIEGSDEAELGVRGSSPEWFDGSTIAYIGEGGQSIEAVEIRTGRRRTLVRSDQLLPHLGTWTIDSFTVDPATDRIAAALVDDQGTAGEADDAFVLARIDEGGDPATALVGPSVDPFIAPDLSAAGRLVVATLDGLALVEIDTGQISPLSSPGHVVTTPVWSRDGTELAWVGNGIAGKAGTARLLVARVGESDLAEPRVVVGDRNQPLDRFPAFPDW